MQVLLVEDNPMDADLLQRALGRASGPFAVTHAPTLAQARNALAGDATFDLVLTDLHLPDGHGLDLIAEIRSQGLPLAVVVLTGQGDEDLVLAVMKTGANDYLAKVEGYTDLLADRLSSALAGFRARSTPQAQALKVLYAEHHAADADLTRRHIEAFAPSILLQCVDDAPAALARLPIGPGQRCEVDVLLLDYRLAGDDGLELLRTLRQQRGLDLPVVMVTGQGSEVIAAQAMLLGATDYVVKRGHYLQALPHVLESAYHRVQAQREQAALRALNASLERMVSERTAELAAAKEAAEAANLGKSAFLARMSHDLRTPLNAVLGFSQLLSMSPAVSQSATARRQVQHIHDAGKHLLAMIDEVLELARIEAGGLRLEIEALDPATLAREALSLVEPLASRHQVQLHCDAPLGLPAVRADRTRLQQVLMNLLSNAIKYNRPQGQVRVQLADAGDGQVRLDVQDQGQGLSPEQLAQLFQPFNRVGAEDSGIEGTGLGLVIARQLLQAMAGRLTVVSSPGQGSIFTVWLPATDGALAEPPASPLAPALGLAPLGAAPRLKVLYIEDNEVNVSLMTAMLSWRADVTLAVATDGPSGLEAVRRLQPDLVLLDMDLPGLSGMEVQARLRAEPATAGVRCVAVSANALGPEILQALDAGFADYLTKPFSLEALLAVLDATLIDLGRPLPGA